MKISLGLFIYLLHGINCMENAYLTKYLNDRAKIVGEKLIRHARKKENLYTVKLNNTNIDLIGNYSHGEIFTFFNTPYALVDQDLYEISQNNSTVIHVLRKKDVIFVKTTEFQSLGFVAFATKESLHISGFHKRTQKFFKIQNILTKVTDATFFQNHNNLYLITSNYKTPDLASIIIYKFVQTHFDETVKFEASGASKIHTFPSEQSEIILILHKEGKTSSLYEFHEDKIKTIQKIDTKRPEQVLDYLYEGKRHVLIFGQSGTDLYLWSGIDLLLWDQFTENVGQKTLIFYVKNDPFVLSKNNVFREIIIKILSNSELQESFLLFSLSNNKFNLVYKSNFNLNYVNLWSMVMHKNELITLGPTINNSVTINKVTILVQMNNLAENLMEQETTLSDCFLTLEKTVYALRNKLTQNDTLLRAANDGVNKFPGEKFEKLIEKYESVEKSLRNRKSQSLIVDESAILQIPLKTKKLLARKIKFEEIKNEKWQPQKWLLYSKPQNISGPVTAQMLQVTNLNTKQNKLFDDLLLSTGGQKLSGFVTTNNLETSQIATNSINEIPVDEFCYTTRPIRVEGVKTFPELRAKNIHTAAINGIGAKKTVTLLSQQLKYNFAPNVTIGDLWVENLNEIDFENFKNSVFRIGVSDTITGNLTFPNLLSTKVRFGTLSQNQDFLTTSTDQIVNSTITIPKIFTHDVKTARINGANFTNLATLNDTITGPVTIKDLNIRNNLELEGEIETEFLQINNTHIMGTHESDFFQRYDGRVKIQGNLYLRNFELGNSAKILISGEEFEPEMGRFWSKSGQQEIPTHFEAQNGISTPHLTTIFVNNVHVGDYMLNSTQQKKKTKFYFDNVTIRGNVLLNPDEEHSPDLRRIQEEAVIINGTFNIRGRKTYKNVLKVHELELNHLNNVDTISAGPQKIQNLVIKGDLKSENLTTQTLNGVNLTDLIANTVYLDKAQNVPKLNFNNISVDNLFVTSKLNNKNVNELVANLDKINNISKIENVIVSDNVTIKNVENLARINDFSTDKLMSKSHSKYHDGTIFGDVRFLGNVKIRDLQVVVINDVNFEKLSKRVLYKSWNQTIEEHFVFNRLISDNLITDQINEFEVANLIDISSTKSQVIFAPRGLKFAKNTTIQNLFANIGCDLNEGLTNLRNPPSQLWGEIVVNGNATFWDSESLISDIFENVVTTRKNHTIRGKVNFAHHVFANNMTALKNVNNVNISEIIKDAFVNKPNLEQVITGRKIFQKLEAEDVDSLQNTNVSSINELKISEIDAKLIKNALDVPIKGKKVFFGGLQTKKIETGFISGVGAENLVSFVNATQVPNAIFGSVVVLENFNVKFINNMPLDVVLNERFLKKGPKQVLTGNYFLRNVKFTGNVTTPRINDVEMENVVYDDKHIINSLKKFNHFVVLGNVDVELINGFKLSQLYEQAVLINEETNFKKSVYVNKPTFMDGNIETNYINNISVNYMLETSNQNSLNSNTEQIRKIATIVTNFIKTYFNSTIRMPTEVMYLEKSKDLQISLPNVIGAEVVKTKNDVLIHIESEEEGSSCGLPPTCKCPLQQTMQVSSKHSVNMFLNKATQRIYSHYDENIVVHFITHSISTDSYCSTNKNKVMDEISSLTWTVTPYGNNTGGFFIHRGFFNGYITGVKFFTIYGKTYIVVGIYYDPILETHAVDSLVLRFNQDQTKIEKVQRIPTVGLKTISLFPTAQGVVLVMGVDVSGRYNSTNTKIFRFDHHKEQFELLRELPTFDCLFAEGVVLEMDSLIVLANQRSALHILKYHPNFDNYYFYQSFQLDYPVSSLSVFYAEGFGISDAYLSVVTKNNKYFIFSFQFIAGWKVESTGQLDGIKVLVPFTINKKSYILAPSKTSSLLAVVEHDSD